MQGSTVVRAHMCSVGGSKNVRQREQYLGRSRGGFSNGINLVVDALGVPSRFILTGCERHDITLAESLLAPFDFGSVIADRAYDREGLRKQLYVSQVEVAIPSSPHRRQ